MLRLEGVCVSFGSVRAVDDVSFAVGDNSIGIVGANGAGKTTLLNAVSGLTSVTRGKIWYGSVLLSDLPASGRPAVGIGRSFQHPDLVSALTVEESVQLGASRIEGAEVRSIVREVGLERWVRSRVEELPFGVRKVVDLARAMLGGKSVLLCDEPFSGLDALGREEMQGVLARIKAGGRQLVLIEHDIPRAAELVDRFVVLHVGRLIFEGTPAEAMNDSSAGSALRGIV